MLSVKSECNLYGLFFFFTILIIKKGIYTISTGPSSECFDVIRRLKRELRVKICKKKKLVHIIFTIKDFLWWWANLSPKGFTEPATGSVNPFGERFADIVLDNIKLLNFIKEYVIFIHFFDRWFVSLFLDNTKSHLKNL